ncbi:HEPN domain-containing protein [Polymorphospora sp. NPDC050346]|uniref:HEPN domain-containing protein n=1 Tax=Polymorphospora sp. NPDC050346 TaxID=3155780 RepID=UPI00340BFA51
MKPLDATGKFWLPGTNSIERHGRLVFDPKDGAVLHLADALAERTADGAMERIGGRRSRIIGVIDEVSGSQPVTLVDCGWMHKKKYLVNAILIGGHFEDDDDTIFESVIVRLRDAAPWVNKDGIAVEVDSAIEGVDRREMICRLDRPVASEARFARGKVALDFRWSPETVDLESFKVNQWPEFVIEYDTMTPLVGVIDDAGHLYNLSSLCVDRADSFDGVYLYRSDLPDKVLSGDVIPGTRRSIELKARLGNPMQRAEVSSLSAGDVLVPFDDLGGIEAVATWLNEVPSWMPIVGSLLTMRSVGIYSENKFLNISSAAEGLHRATVGGSYMLKPDFERLRRKIRNESVPEEHHPWFIEVMGHANDPSLHRRLRELANEIGVGIYFLAGGDVERWIKAIKKARNNLTHLDKDRDPIDGADLNLLAESLFHVTRLCLLNRIGLADYRLPQMAESSWSPGMSRYVEMAIQRIIGPPPTQPAGEAG